MNNKIKFQLSQAEIEYLADLLSYEIADPEPRMAFHLEPEQVEELQNRLKNCLLSSTHTHQIQTNGNKTKIPGIRKTLKIGSINLLIRSC